MKKDLIKVVAQGFYGNRTGTEINREEIDRFVLGYLDDSITITEKIDRTIVNVPNTDNIVIVYNKYEEEYELARKEKLLNEENYELKPNVIIPENNFEIYSRCIVCKVNEDGEFESLKNGDYEKFVKYLAE